MTHLKKESATQTNPSRLKVWGMPYDWIMPSVDTLGKVAIEVWLQSSFEGRRTFRCFYKRLENWWGIKPWTIRRALQKLEQRGCISVKRKAGARAIITILNPPRALLKARIHQQVTEIRRESCDK